MANRRPLVLGPDGLLQQLQAADLLSGAASVAYDPAASGLPATEVQSAVDALNGIVAQGGSRLVSGGGVAWSGSGYTYHVSAATYYLAGVLHTSPAATVTLATPDATYGRQDVIAVNDSGAVVVIQGTPAPAPALPDVDPAAQLSLSEVSVGAASTAPAVTVIPVYTDNLGTGGGEWAATTSPGTVNANSTSNPRTGTKCVEYTAAAANAALAFTAAAPLDVNQSQNVVFWLRSKGTWGAKSVNVQFLSAGTYVGKAVNVAQGSFGFNSLNTTTYQQVVIPVVQFAVPAGTLPNQLQLFLVGGGATIGFYVDDVSLQSGVTTPAAAGLTQDQADARYAQRAASLSDLASVNAAQTNLGLRTRHVIADGATVTVDATLGRQQEVTLGGNRTVAFANWVDGDEIKLDLIQDGTGSRTLTWPTVRWAGGIAPTLTAAAGKWDTVVIRRRGTEYAGYLAGANI